MGVERPVGPDAAIRMDAVSRRCDDDHRLRSSLARDRRPGLLENVPRPGRANGWTEVPERGDLRLQRFWRDHTVHADLLVVGSQRQLLDTGRFAHVQSWRPLSEDRRVY